MRSADCIFASIPTKSNVLDVRMHVSRKPEDRTRPSKPVFVSSKLDTPDNRSYTANGGKSSAVHPDIDEYDADANKYGKGMSKLVNASGNENHDVDAAGMLSNAGRYGILRTSLGRPRSDSPLGLLFIGE